MTRTLATRFAAFNLAAIVVLASWVQTLSVPFAAGGIA